MTSLVKNKPLLQVKTISKKIVDQLRGVGLGDNFTFHQKTVVGKIVGTDWLIVEDQNNGHINKVDSNVLVEYRASCTSMDKDAVRNRTYREIENFDQLFLS